MHDIQNYAIAKSTDLTRTSPLDSISRILWLVKEQEIQMLKLAAQDPLNFAVGPFLSELHNFIKAEAHAVGIREV